MSEDMTERPTIDPESPCTPLIQKIRRNEMKKRIPKYEGSDYAKMYRTMKKYRDKQEELLDGADSDPDPFVPTYIFYCFQGKIDD
jgi:hypothetical protein